MPPRSSPRNPRATRACARCRKRKIKCDLAYPQCGTCVAVREKCFGFNSATGQEQPRSLVSFLEEKVARLEVQLGSFQGSEATSVSNAGDGLKCGRSSVSAGLRRAVTLGNGLRGDSWPWNAAPYLSPSPYPTLHAGVVRGLNGSLDRSPKDIASIPRNVLDVMLKHYSEKYLAQYLILEESELMQRCDRVCNRVGTAFDNFVVCIALSISAHTLIQHDRIRAIKAADEFYESALVHLDEIWKQDAFTQLQAIMLICHYGFVNPSAANPVACSHAAMTLCVQIGLHRDSPTRRVDVESQRRIFWTCYTLDAQNRMLMAKTFDIDRTQLTVPYPTIPAFDKDARVATSTYLYAFRQLETEITMGLFHPESCDSRIARSSWLEDVRARIKLWRERLELEHFAAKVEFREVMFQFQCLRLSRPSPRFPMPGTEMRRECITAATALVAHYDRVMKTGGFFYWYHACWHLFEIGVVLVDTANFALDLVWRGKDSFLRGETGDIVQSLRCIPVILRSMRYRWTQVEAVVVELEQTIDPVLDRLDKWINGVPTPPHEIHSCAIKTYLLGRGWKELEGVQPERWSPADAAMSRGAAPRLTLQRDACFDSPLIEGASFWQGNGFELDDLFAAFDAGIV
ncbi:hypothetical protein BDV18DRAFT_157173 [Aspergillus unguis]